MLNVTVEMLQTLWIQTNEFLPINTAQLSEIVKSNLPNLELNSNSDYVTLLVLFLLLYVIFSILSMLVRLLLGTVVGMIRFGFYIAMAIALYWIYASIDVEKGNEELRVTKERLVKGAQEFVHRDF